MFRNSYSKFDGLSSDTAQNLVPPLTSGVGIKNILMS